MTPLYSASRASRAGRWRRVRNRYLWWWPVVAILLALAAGWALVAFGIYEVVRWLI